MPIEFPPVPDSSYFTDQLSIVEIILQSCSSLEQASALTTTQDVHGNTSLHYLMGHRDVHLKLVQLLRDIPGGEETLVEAKNIWGYTPAELSSEQKEAEETKESGVIQKKAFWHDRSGVILFGEEMD